MKLLRSLAFNLFFYLHTIVWLIVLLPVQVLPERVFWWCVSTWAAVNRRALGVLAGVTVEIRGLDHLPPGGALVVSKHQSTFETVALLDLFHEPAFVLKRELMRIPLFGWYAHKARQIPIDRGAGRKALASMSRRARAEAASGRQIVIYPEGTRRPAGAEPAYKPGVAFLYRDLGVPMVPVALTSGLFWPRHGFIRHPGRLVVEFLPAIPPGRDAMAAFEAAKEAIETATDRLIGEALAAPNPPPLPAEGADFRRRHPAV